ncbi:MAG: CBS domain-containing protein [Bacteroidetes bacterium]|nr:CBS domain-containing protein [Bacteroidota bacterium]
MNNRVTSLKIRQLAYELRIENAMSRDVITVGPDDVISDVRNMLKDNRISGLPVVKGDTLVGIISIENFIKCIMGGGTDNRVKDNMTSDVKCVYANEPLIDGIRKLEQFGYGRFPVLEPETGNLVGILTKGDIVRCLLRRLETDYQEGEISSYRASHIFEDMQSDRTSIVFRYKVQGGNYRAAGEQSGYLKSNLVKLGVHPKITRRVAIASCEAEMNIVIFTDGGELLANIEENEITVNAVDHGPGIPDIERAMHPGFSTAPDWVREMGFGAGMGLPNIQECSDTMRIDSKVGEGTNVEFVVKTR